MVKKIGRVIIAMLGVMVFALVMTWVSTRFKSKLNPAETTAIVSPTPLPEFADKWGVWENKTRGFSVEFPADWQAAEMKNDGNFDIRTVVTRGVEGPAIGSLTELSVTVVSKPKSGQELSTQKEFDQWMAKPDMATDSAEIHKISSAVVDGNRAINLISGGVNEKGVPYWVLSTWLRKNNTNYYINSMGEGSYNGDELWIHNKMVSSFKFL